MEELVDGYGCFGEGLLRTRMSHASATLSDCAPSGRGAKWTTPGRFAMGDARSWILTLAKEVRNC